MSIMNMNCHPHLAPSGHLILAVTHHADRQGRRCAHQSPHGPNAKTAASHRRTNPIRKVDKGRRVNLPPPPLESHPPGRHLAYRRQKQPIAAQTARWCMMENAIVIVVTVTQGQAEARVWLQEIVEPQGLRPSSSSSSSRWKSINESKTHFANCKPSLQISINWND
jgi:hypothetical protein